MKSPGIPNFKIFISDTTCLIILEKINALDLLHQLSSQVITTPEIKKEFGGELPGWIDLQAADDKTLAEAFRQDVDLGEATAIALALELKDVVLLLDDRKARALANRMGLDFMGSVGVLLKAKEHGIIKSVKAYTDRILQTNFRISQSIIEQALQQAGEL